MRHTDLLFTIRERERQTLPSEPSLEIDLGALCANYNILKQRAAPAECAAVVKANAYGHGLSIVGHALSSQADFFGVASTNSDDPHAPDFVLTAIKLFLYVVV